MKPIIRCCSQQKLKCFVTSWFTLSEQLVFAAHTRRGKWAQSLFHQGAECLYGPPGKWHLRKLSSDLAGQEASCKVGLEPEMPSPCRRACLGKCITSHWSAFSRVCQSKPTHSCPLKCCSDSLILSFSLDISELEDPCGFKTSYHITEFVGITLFVIYAVFMLESPSFSCLSLMR